MAGRGQMYRMMIGFMRMSCNVSVICLGDFRSKVECKVVAEPV